MSSYLKFYYQVKYVTASIHKARTHIERQSYYYNGIYAYYI